MIRITAILIAPLLALALNAYAATATFTPMSVSASILPNPDRGGVSNVGYPDIVNNTDGIAAIAAGISAGKRLGLCILSLNAWINSDSISQVYLDSLSAKLAWVRDNGMKCVMRIQYSTQMSTPPTDAPIARIRLHVAQLKPIFRANADSIAYAPAGFIGPWGEWHSSSNCNSYNLGQVTGVQPVGCTDATADANRREVTSLALDMYGPTVFVQSRYPSDVARTTWYPTALTKAQAFSGSRQSQLGVFNDCQFSAGPDTLGDTYTFGTYQSGKTSDQLRAYVATLSEFTPYGGETANNCQAPTRFTCAEVKTDLAKYHATWLKNMGGDSTMRAALSSGGCTNEVENLQGYRLQYDSITHPDSVTRGSSISATITLRNVGYARFMFSRRVQLVLINGTSSIICSAPTDLRNLPAQAVASSTIKVSCAIPGTATVGQWAVHLRIPDIRATTKDVAIFATRPANADSGLQVWNSANFRWTTGTSIGVTAP